MLISVPDCNPEALNLQRDISKNFLERRAGSGTTLVAARDLGRNWIGIDSSPKAIEVILKRLNTKHKQLTDGGYAYYEEVKEAKNSSFSDRYLNTK
jgi:DNA modification methylase